MGVQVSKTSHAKLFYGPECPYSTKVLVFLAEAKLVDEFELVEIKTKAEMQEHKVEQIPCLDVDGELVLESDKIIEEICKYFGIDQEELKVLSVFKKGLMKQFLSMHEHLRQLAGGQDEENSHSQVCGWFKYLDANRDGEVDLDELLDGLEATRTLAEARRGFKIPDSKWTFAFEQVEELINENPKFVQAHRLKMVLATISDSYDAFWEASSKILDLEPEDPQTLLLRAVYAKSFEKDDEYESLLDELQKTSPATAKATKHLVARVSHFWEEKLSGEIPKDIDEKLSILALGSPANEDGTPQPRLLGTLKKTLEAAEAYPNASIFVTGAAVSTSMPEAIAMKRWLVEHGVDKTRIIMEMKARDTVGNYVNIAPFLREKDVHKVVLITVLYHLNRSSILAEAVFEQENLNVDIVPVAGESDLKGETLDKRLTTERAASYRDLARAMHLYDAKDFKMQCL